MAYTFHFDLRHFRLTNFLNRLRQFQFVEFFTVKIAGQSALGTNKMMVAAKIGVKAGSRAEAPGF